ncbi:MAG: SUMF1/EgtB/PvdO family nonheme iron enzyme [Kiritimatiellae bacterium]|nr:SUMF1/EgtB/PvdO family nonheme iron enzyme [Kiritimatiellia bacterium]
MNDAPTAGTPEHDRAPRVLQPGHTLGQYRIVRLLGRGGMGEVYEAEHQVLGLNYALKLLPSDFAARPGALERFQREARVMAQLQHPNILRVDEFGGNDGRYWLRMELATGLPIDEKPVSLQDYADALGGRVPQDELLKILTQVVGGLAYAHAHGAIHRDLKPSNILLAGCDAAGIEAKIADFGLVRLVGEEWVRSRAEVSVQMSMGLGQGDGPQVSLGEARTLGGPDAAGGGGSSTRAMLGTYAYMSPEQKKGEDADERSDLYAVGLMAFRLLTGQSDFSFELPSELDGGLVPEWDAFVKETLRPDRGRRVADAGSAAALLGTVRAAMARSPAEPAVRRTPRPKRPAAEKKLAKSHPAAEEKRRDAKTGSPPLPKAAAKRAEAVPSGPPLPSAADLAAYAEAGYADLQGLAEGSAEAQQRQRAAVAGLGLPLEVENRAVGVRFRLVPPGTLLSPQQKEVRISSAFYMGIFEITQGQWEEVMGGNPSMHAKAGRDAPVETVDWGECCEFCEKLCRLADVPLGTYRLPTEAEWEHACRAGTRLRYYTGKRKSDLKRAAAFGGWFKGPRPVGQLAPNAWGLYDMLGNVAEWCSDWYAEPAAGPATDPTGPKQGTHRVARGGGWLDIAWGCEVTARFKHKPGHKNQDLGLRVVRVLPEQA